jgi:putative transposase
MIPPISLTKARGRPIPGYSLTQCGQKVPDAQIEDYLMEYAHDEWLNTSGYRKWTAYLRHDFDLVINKKKVYRLCQGLGILHSRRPVRSAYPRHVARTRCITGPNQLWQMDIKYGVIADSGRFFFTCSVIDVYDRTIVGYLRAPECRWQMVCQMLTKAFLTRSIHLHPESFEKKLILRTDNGPQFVSRGFGKYLSHHKVYHERIPPKTPNMNAYIESFHSQFQRDCLGPRRFEFFEEAYYNVDEYMAFYNGRRAHGSLDHLPPAVFHQQTMEGRLPRQELWV